LAVHFGFAERVFSGQRTDLAGEHALFEKTGVPGCRSSFPAGRTAVSTFHKAARAFSPNPPK